MVYRWKFGDGSDPTYRAALAAPHTVYSRLDIVDPLTMKPVLSNVSFGSATVTATLQNRVARTLKATVDQSLFPLTSAGQVDYDAPLCPVGNRLAAYRGIEYRDGTLVYFPVFYGPIQTVQMDETGQVQVQASDEAAEVVAAQFEQPTNSNTGNTCGTEWQRLISMDGVIPGGARFGTSDTSHTLCPNLTWNTDRAQACDDLTAADSMLWYPLADGAFVRRLVPWTNPAATPVLTLVDGGDNYHAVPVSSPTISKYTISVTRVGVPNAVTYLSERMDGTAPAAATVRDMDPSSPTYYLGKFGRKPVTVQNQAAQSQPQCLQAATVTLNTAKAITAPWDNVTVPIDGSAELGDMYQMGAGGAQALQVITGFSFPLRETGTMTLNMRAWAPTS